MDGRSFTSVYQRLLTNGTDGCAGQRKLRGSFARKEPGGMDRPIFSNILSQTNNPLISKKIIIWWQTRRISCFSQNSLPQESARGCPLCHRVGGLSHLYQSTYLPLTRELSFAHIVTLDKRIYLIFWCWKIFDFFTRGVVLYAKLDVISAQCDEKGSTLLYYISLLLGWSSQKPKYK